MLFPNVRAWFYKLGLPDELFRGGRRYAYSSSPMIAALFVDLEVCGAKDGSEALQKARELSPDLILLDISMPGMNGLEVARRLRQELRQAKILVISQHDPLQLLPSVIAAGADGCIDKSRLCEDLVASIKKIKCA